MGASYGAQPSLLWGWKCGSCDIVPEEAREGGETRPLVAWWDRLHHATPYTVKVRE